MKKVTILGSGMAGFGAANLLKNEGVDSVIFDKNQHYGGHTASYKFNEGYTFDEGPHVSFTKNEKVQKFLADSVNQEYETIHTVVNNYWKGIWIKHPVQCNLHDLPKALIVDCIKDFVYAMHNDYGAINNYEDWLKASFGKTIAENFPMEYGLRYHTTTAGNMSTDWLGPRLYRPKLEEVIYGAISPTTPDVHYISHFRYPTHNGFVNYLNPLPNLTDIVLGHKVEKIDPVSKTIYFENGREEKYDSLVSSIPLPDLLPMITNAPADVIEASQLLACTQCVVVSVGVKRKDITPAHWSYFYDRDFSFTRLSFPHNLSPETVPEGHSSIQAEVYFSDKYKPMTGTPDDCIEPAIKDLIRCGLLREDDDIDFKHAMYIPYANVIFDLDRKSNLAKVHGFLDDIEIHYAGRYGEWGYMWTDESFLSGERAAKKILNKVTSD